MTYTYIYNLIIALLIFSAPFFASCVGDDDQTLTTTSISTPEGDTPEEEKPENEGKQKPPAPHKVAPKS